MPGAPLEGVRVLEVQGVGPTTLAAMVLADLGAEVLRIDSASSGGHPEDWMMRRGRRSVAVDLRAPDGAEVVLRLAAQADVLIEGFRPGVAERLGIGPQACQERNPALTYVRATGWGQDGPYRSIPGHDINYIATTGVLAALVRDDGRPVPPLNLLGDYGGGGMLAAVGALAGLTGARVTGRGQVVDAAMVDGVALLSSLIWSMRGQGRWRDEPEANLLDGGCPFYDVYRTDDDGWLAVGAIEPKFFAALLRTLELTEEFPDQFDTGAWPRMRKRFAAAIAARPREHWIKQMATDQCLAPVLSWAEASADPHNRARGVLIEVDGVTQPAPAPRFSGMPAPVVSAPPRPGQHTVAALRDWGFDDVEVDRLRESGAVVQD